MELYERRIKKTNFFFLILVILYLGFSFGMRFLLENALVQSFLGEFFLFLIGVIFLIYWKVDWREYLRLRRIDAVTIIFSILYVFCLVPIVAVINGLSMIFVENKAATSISSMITGGFCSTFLVIAIVPGIVEEFLFRGIVYRGYRQARPVRGMLYSALLFGALHMNFNQFSYAFFMGIALAVLTEVTDSLYPGILVHILFNGQSVCLTFLIQKLEQLIIGMGGMNEFHRGVQDSMNITTQSLFYTIGFYLPFAVGGGVAAFFLLRALAKRNRRYEYSKTWFLREEREILPKPKLINISLVLGLLICIGMCFIQEFY